VAHDYQTAKNEQKTATQIVRQIDELRDQVSGISLDEEAMSMLKYQRAYEANARFFNAVNSALDILFHTLGGA
jgi:flagellar hook-associated protein 1 FlgK